MNDEKVSEIKSAIDEIRSIENDSFYLDEDKVCANYIQLQNEQKSVLVNVLSIVGAAFALSSFMGVLETAGLFGYTAVVFSIGLLFTIASIAINAKADRQIIDSVLLPLYLAGVSLLGFALVKYHLDQGVIRLALLAVGLITLISCQRYLMSLAATVLILTVLQSFLFLYKVSEGIHFYNALLSLFLISLFYQEAFWIKKSNRLNRLYEPIRTATWISLLVGLLFISTGSVIRNDYQLKWISSIIPMLFLLFVVYQSLFSHPNSFAKKERISLFLISLLLISLMANIPTVLNALLLLFLSLRVRYLMGILVSAIAVIGFMIQFYYLLEVTLLTKSIYLISSGIVCLGLFFYLKRSTDLRLTVSLKRNN